MGVVEDCQHLFIECSMVREGWGWLRRLKISLLMPDCTRMSEQLGVLASDIS